MTITQNICKSYLLEREQGIHVWGTDVMKLALYDGSASLDPNTVTAYTATHEVAGSGYSAGGIVLALASGFPKLSPAGTRMVLFDFDDIGPLAGAGFTFQGGLIYNFSKANRAVATLNFGGPLVVTASYGVVWPVPDDNSAIMRLGA